MKAHSTVPKKKKLAIAILSVAGCLFLFGMLPGKIEGAYRGFGIQCLCDSLHFAQFRDGRLLMYASRHPPANLCGRYESRNSDGSIHIYFEASSEQESDALILKAYPRKLFTRFEHVPSGRSEWAFKSPLTPLMRKMIASQEIESTFITEDLKLVKSYYDRDLNLLRHETK